MAGREIDVKVAPAGDEPEWARPLAKALAAVGPIVATSASKGRAGVVAYAFVVERGDEALAVAVGASDPTVWLALRCDPALALSAMAHARSAVHRSAARLVPGAEVGIHGADLGFLDVAARWPALRVAEARPEWLPLAEARGAGVVPWALLGDPAGARALDAVGPVEASAPEPASLASMFGALRAGSEPLLSNAAWALGRLAEEEEGYETVLPALHALAAEPDLAPQAAEVVGVLLDELEGTGEDEDVDPDAGSQEA